jgi:hypothetical protein
MKNKLVGLWNEAGVAQLDVISLKRLEKIPAVAVWMVDVSTEIPISRLRNNATTRANLTTSMTPFFAVSLLLTREVLWCCSTFVMNSY